MLYSRDTLQRATGPLIIGLAYAGGSTTGSYSGGAHLLTVHDLNRGRLKRSAGDALCKPAEKFWGLEPEPERAPLTVTCKRCRELAVRSGLVEAPNGSAEVRR